ncbi:hypothetical protein BVRB_9g210040 [Beta vulgaris subsp. vulgaris]|nr:hypothetical protein BVRB_9g210040 [Beta vulgaris subsp. vulgaris]
MFIIPDVVGHLSFWCVGEATTLFAWSHGRPNNRENVVKASTTVKSASQIQYLYPVED